MQRIAIVFDDRLRPETTGTYCRRALEQLVPQVVHFQPDQLSEVPRDGFGLYLSIDDGLALDWPEDLRPAAYWAIDTHLDFSRNVARSRGFDWVFAAQRDGAQALRSAGVESAEWLPLACDPAVHRRHEVDTQFDVCFVGHLFEGPRTDLARLLQQHFPRSFVGQRFFDEMARTYSASRLVFNRSIRNDVNMRVFEAVACGSLLLTNDLSDNGQAELLRDGVHLAIYRDAEELLDKARFYLARHELRERIAQRGMAEVLAAHTYGHRMRRVLERCAEALKESPRKAFTPTSARPADESSRKSPSYFQFARPELLDCISPSARRILEIGCGGGALGRSVKKRQAAHYVGVELDPQAARQAHDVIDEVYVANVETDPLEFAEGPFDTVVCGDVLEHLDDPLTVLRRLRNWLSPRGQLVASIPNIRHHSLIAGLLDGNWTYEPAGLLDDTHRRLMDRFDIERLFYRAGFQIRQLSRLAGPGDPTADQVESDGPLRIGHLCLAGLTSEEKAEFFTYQYLIVAEPVPVPARPLTSLIIPVCNQWNYTRQCLDSIRSFTDEPYEIIVVDNGSTDGTAEFLEDYGEVRVITNRKNEGFPKAVNRGIRAARGDFIVILNNDVIVTTGWLRRLLAGFDQGADVGLVGPYTNCTSP